MGKGSHGHGQSGQGHSHDPEHPDDDWNLYALIDPQLSTALNVTSQDSALAIFKPYVNRMDVEPFVESDADEEIIFKLVFESPVSIRRIMVIGGPDGVAQEQGPALLRCYPETSHDIDFNNVADYNPGFGNDFLSFFSFFHIAQEFELTPNVHGEDMHTTTLTPFSNITSLTLYFPSNFGGHEQTRIQYIGLQGDHTHHKREAVDTEYELLCKHSEEHKSADEKQFRSQIS